MSKIYESKIFDIRKKKNREKNFSFQRFLLNSMFFVLSREGYGVIPSEGESRNLPLPADLSTAARGDMKHDRGIRSFDCAQGDRLPLEVTKERSGRASV